MKTDRFTKTLLGIIALALAVIAVQGTFSHSVQAASTITPFEYKFISRVYVPDWQKGEAVLSPVWSEDGQKASDDDVKNGGIGARIQYLGSQGWELISDNVVSQHMLVNIDKHVATNGVASYEHMIFKKRK